MRRIDLPHRIAAPKWLPVPPTAEDVDRLTAVLARPDVQLPTIAKVMESSPGLRSALLKAANSAEFGLQCAIVQVKHAVALLGVRRLQYLAQSMAAEVAERGAQ